MSTESARIPAYYGLYSIRDSAADYYGPVLQFRTDAEAIRSFVAFLASTPDAQPALYPESFDLCRVGRFDAASGILLPDLSSSIITAVSALNIVRRLKEGAAVGDTSPEDKAPKVPDGSVPPVVSDPSTVDLHPDLFPSTPVNNNKNGE